MKATLKRFWFWLAQRPPLLVSIGVVFLLIGVMTLEAVLNPSSQSTSTSSSTTSSKYSTTTVSNGNSIWTYSDLTAAAAAGQLKSVLISGSSAVATTIDGKTYDVYLPDNNADLAKTLD